MRRSPCSHCTREDPSPQGAPPGPLLRAPTLRFCAGLCGPLTHLEMDSSRCRAFCSSSCICLLMSLSPSEAEDGVPSSSQRSRNALDWGWQGSKSNLGSESGSGSPQPSCSPNPYIQLRLGVAGHCHPLSTPQPRPGPGGDSSLPGTFRCCSCRRSSSNCLRLFSISACFFRFS